MVFSPSHFLPFPMWLDSRTGCSLAGRRGRPGENSAPRLSGDGKKDWQKGTSRPGAIELEYCFFLYDHTLSRLESACQLRRGRRHCLERIASSKKKKLNQQCEKEKRRARPSVTPAGKKMCGRQEGRTFSTRCLSVAGDFFFLFPKEKNPHAAVRRQKGKFSEDMSDGHPPLPQFCCNFVFHKELPSQMFEGETRLDLIFGVCLLNWHPGFFHVLHPFFVFFFFFSILLKQNLTPRVTITT